MCLLIYGLPIVSCAVGRSRRSSGSRPLTRTCAIRSKCARSQLLFFPANLTGIDKPVVEQRLNLLRDIAALLELVHLRCDHESHARLSCDRRRTGSRDEATSMIRMRSDRVARRGLRARDECHGADPHMPDVRARRGLLALGRHRSRRTSCGMATAPSGDGLSYGTCALPAREGNANGVRLPPLPQWNSTWSRSKSLTT